MSIAIGLLASAIGCDSGPHAPVLRDSPVYQNNREGLRFLVPDNWVQSANAVLPREKLEKEVILVQYRMRTANAGASLEVLCFDEDEPSDLAEYHQKPSHGQNWKEKQPAEPIDVNGIAANRLTYEAASTGRKMIKEVVDFRRGDRVYSFIGLFWDEDKKAQEQLRRAVASIIWKG